jgi:hypothetical protein
MIGYEQFMREEGPGCARKAIASVWALYLYRDDWSWTL